MNDVMILLILQFTTFVCFGVYVSVQIADIRRTARESAEVLRKSFDYEEFIDSYSDSEESISEEEAEAIRVAEERKREYDERIERIREELANQPIPKKPILTPAEELHPGVKNLPHDSIIDYETNPPDVEYVD